MATERTSTGGPDGVISLATLALVSTYIADERPEGDSLGDYAEIAQAFSVVLFGIALGIGAIVLIVGLLVLAAGDRG